MAETGRRLEQPVSSGRVLSWFRGSLRAEPPSSFDHGGRTGPDPGYFMEIRVGNGLIRYDNSENVLEELTLRNLDIE
ncbi:hypothetical protein ANTRET_LOCUS9308 [Anthophora retusa]